MLKILRNFCLKKLWRKKFFYKDKNMALEEIFLSVGSLNAGEFLSSTIHLLPLIYPFFTCVDPDP